MTPARAVTAVLTRPSLAVPSQDIRGVGASGETIPNDGDSFDDAIDNLLGNPRVDARFAPSSAGAAEAGALQGGANASHQGDPKFDTADFADGAPGNLRADYVLPSKGLRPVGSAVFWPVSSDPLSG